MSGLSKSEYSATRGSKASSYSSSNRYHPYSQSSSSLSNNNDRQRPRSDRTSTDKSDRSDRYERNSYGGSRAGRGSTNRNNDKRSSHSLPNLNRFEYKKNGKKPENEFGIKFGEIGAGLSPVEWSNVTLKPFKRDFYTEIECESVANRSKSEVDEWKKEHDIECFAGYHENIKKGNKNGTNESDNYRNWNKRWRSDDFAATEEEAQAEENGNNKLNDEKKSQLLNPVQEFSECGFSSVIMSAISKAGFAKPTPIQCATWPMILAGNNVIGIAQTGSGKTLAFLLPAVIHITDQPRLKYGDGPIALIIAPTRELACQIEGEVSKFACNLRHCCVYGGAKRWDQKRKLKSGVEIVIATPGRLLDFLESGVTNLRRVTYCVIDEADRLLDMGFEPQLNAILNQIRPDRQISMFSATWPKEVRTLAKKFMMTNKDKETNKYEIMQVAIGSTDSLKANSDVKQMIRFVDRTSKIKILKEIIDEQMGKDSNSKILVFISTKKMCNTMQDILWNDGYWVTTIHGDKEQKQRDRALQAFKRGDMKILLATDVASRGIHVDDIVLVVNFDFPMNIEDYVHRIGRTGRANKKGNAISLFVKENDGYRAKDLIKILKDSKQEIPKELIECKHMRKKSRNGRYGGGRSNFYRSGRRW